MGRVVSPRPVRWKGTFHQWLRSGPWSSRIFPTTCAYRWSVSLVSAHSASGMLGNIGTEDVTGPTAPPPASAALWHPPPGRSIHHDPARGRRSLRRREELQGDVVRIPQGQARAVAGVDDVPVRKAQLVQARLPGRQLLPVGAREGHVVQPHATLVEGSVRRALRELVKSEQRVPDGEDDVPERTGVLVQHGVRADEALIPRGAARQVGDGESDVRNRWELLHGFASLVRLHRLRYLSGGQLFRQPT